jgi:sialic acid synthase SpsE
MVDGIETVLAETQELVILHCISSYPAPIEQMNLSLIPKLRQLFGYPVGLSDHTIGVEAACAAVALGARVFEKHITLDKSMAGPDHQASMNPGEMRNYCYTLRRVQAALGDGVKRVMSCEEDTRKAFRRFVVAARDLSPGQIVGLGDLHFKKVVSGISPKYLELVLGTEVAESIPADTTITWGMLKRI